MKKVFLFASVLLFGRVYGVPYDVAIAWLKGTYEPFAATDDATKALSPLMGATAWHSGWIAGLHTWGGVRAKEVHGDRTSFKLVEGDAVAELVDDLFQSVVGDIQPTHVPTHAFYRLMVSDAVDADQVLKGFFTLVHDGTIGDDTPARQQLIKNWVGVTGVSRKFVPQFCNKVGRAVSLCRDGKRYPAFVPEQILAAFAYATFVREASSVDQWLENLTWYMNTLGRAGFHPALYDGAILREKLNENPAVINEDVLIKVLYKRVVPGNVPPLAECGWFDYRGAEKTGTCVEIMLLNFFDFILFDSANQRYRFDLLSPEVQATINQRLRDFYTKFPQASETSNDRTNYWLEAVSGIEGAVQADYESDASQKALAAGNIVYLEHGDKKYVFEGQEKTGMYELESDSRNVLAVINYLLGTRARALEEFGPLLSTSERPVAIAQTGEGFDVTIHDVTVEFYVFKGHSFTEMRGKLCKRADVERALGIEDLQYLCLARQLMSGLSVQQVRYVLYAAGVSDLNFLAKAVRWLLGDKEFARQEKEWWLGLIQELIVMGQRPYPLFYDAFNQSYLIDLVRGDAKNVVLLAQVGKGGTFNVLLSPVLGYVPKDDLIKFLQQILDVQQQLHGRRVGTVDVLEFFNFWSRLLKEKDSDGLARWLRKFPRVIRDNVLVYAFTASDEPGDGLGLAQGALQAEAWVPGDTPYALVKKLFDRSYELGHRLTKSILMRMNSKQTNLLIDDALMAGDKDRISLLLRRATATNHMDELMQFIGGDVVKLCDISVELQDAVLLRQSDPGFVREAWIRGCDAKNRFLETLSVAEKNELLNKQVREWENHDKTVGLILSGADPVSVLAPELRTPEGVRTRWLSRGHLSSASFYNREKEYRDIIEAAARSLESSAPIGQTKGATVGVPA